MNGAPGSYRRFNRELFLESVPNAALAGSDALNSETDSGYQSSSSVEPRKQPITKPNARRSLPMQHFAPVATEVDINASRNPSSLGTLVPRLCLRSGLQRLQKLKITAGSPNSYSKLQPKALNTENINENVEDEHSPLSAANDCQQPEFDHEIQTENEEVGDVGRTSFDSATSSPSCPDANTELEGSSVSVDDTKSDSQVGSPSDSSFSGSTGSSTVNASLRDISKPKPKSTCTYRRFDSRQLIKPISLPSVHPAAQKRSMLDSKSSCSPMMEIRPSEFKKDPDNFNPGRTATIAARNHDLVARSRLRPNKELSSVDKLAHSNEIASLQCGTSTLPSVPNISSPNLQPSSKLLSRPDSLGGFNYVESRHNTRRAKRNADEKKRQERELLINDFNVKLSTEEVMGTFEALVKLAVKGAREWIESNLAVSLEKFSNPLLFVLKLLEFWSITSAQKHSPSHENALSWLGSFLASLLLLLYEKNHMSLQEEDGEHLRQKLMTIGCAVPPRPKLPPKVWASLINRLELPISEDDLIARARELTKIDDLYVFVKELSLQSLLPFKELFTPLIRTRHYKWAAELAQGLPLQLHELIMAVFSQDAKQALRILLDCSVDVHSYPMVEISAKLPELEAIMHQGLLLEFVDLICGDNFDLQLETLKLAYQSGHRSDYDALCSHFEITAEDLVLDPDSIILDECSICSRKQENVIKVAGDYLRLPVEYVFEPCDNDLEYILLGSSLISFDLECRPHFCIWSQADSDKAAVLQLATADCCVILDLTSPIGVRRLSILRSVFQDPNILKLGFGVGSDLQMLAKTLMDPDFCTVQSVLDLQKVVAKIVSTEAKKQSLSLLQACEVILGVQLDKTEQVSNWERRPLRESQMVYAALDAYCLILIAEKIAEDCLITESLPENGEDRNDSDFSILLSMIENIIELNI